MTYQELHAASERVAAALVRAFRVRGQADPRTEPIRPIGTDVNRELRFGRTCLGNIPRLTDSLASVMELWPRGCVGGTTGLPPLGLSDRVRESHPEMAGPKHRGGMGPFH